MKDFIRDEGKIRNCISNEAKMNIFEWMWFEKSMILRVYIDAMVDIFEGIAKIITGLICLVIVIFSPITFPIGAYLSIRRAKKEMLLKGKSPHDRRQ